MQNKSKIIILILLAAVIALLVVLIHRQKKQDSDMSIENGTTQSVLKEYKNDQIGLSFMYPSGYTVAPADYPGIDKTRLTLEIKGKGNSYFVDSFDFYQSAPTSYKYSDLKNDDSFGIFFWRSNGAGPYECYEDMDCTPYSDGFQFGARFETTSSSYKIISFYNGKNFRDNKQNHTLDDVKNLPEFKDWFDIIKTVKIY